MANSKNVNKAMSASSQGIKNTKPNLKLVAGRAAVPMGPNTLGMNIVHVDDYSAQQKRPRSTLLASLKDMGVTVVNGYFDLTRFEAALAEPQWIREKRNEWSLSSRTGLGAIKHVLDGVGLVMVEHECKGSQFLMLRSRQNLRNGGSALSKEKSYCKVYYTNNFQNKGKTTACFNINNFNTDMAPEYYLCVCFEGPMVWAFSRKHLCATWEQLGDADYGTNRDGLVMYMPQIARGALGGLRAILNSKSKFLLTKPSQVGL